MPTLEIIMPDGSRRAHTLAHKPILFGREYGCDIRLPQKSASRRHARIVPVEYGYRIEDLGSVQGTWVNNRRVEAARLRHGDRLIIQDVEARFVDDQPISTVTLSDGGAQEEFRGRSGAAAAQGLSHRRLTSLYELTSRLTALRDVTGLLEEALDICCEMLEFERGAIGLYRGPGEGLDWPVVRHLRGKDGGLTLSRTMLTRALTDGERVIFGSAASELAPGQSAAESAICAALCVPLVSEGQILGVIYGDRVTSGRSYNDEDADFLFALASQVSVGLINARLLEEQKQHVRLEKEMTLAREAQRFLFPKTLPNANGVRSAAINVPGQHVSGDYYDAVRIGPGRYAFLIADVTGKDMAASLLGGSLHGMVQATLPRGAAPAELLVDWNRFVCGHTGGLRFVTCALIVVDTQQRTLTVAVAGHPPPVMVVPGESVCRRLNVSVGLPLGIEENGRYTDTRIELPASGCALLLYTDGVSEAMNPQREEFGIARLEQTALAAAAGTPDDLIAAVEQALTGFSADGGQQDDITLLAVQVGSSE